MITPRRYNGALVFAMMAHKGQKDYGGLPYITHPINVAETVMRQGCSDDAVVAALLHDVVEDTDVTLEEVRQSFGSTVADFVNLLSRTDEETYQEFIGRMIAAAGWDPKFLEVLFIKLADIKDHTRVERRTGRGKENALLIRYAAAEDRLLAAIP